MRKIFDGVLFSTDLDGTLYNRDSLPDAESIEAIARFIELGGHFMINTGRARQTNTALRLGVPTNAPCSVGNGSELFDPATGERFESHLMDDSAMDMINDVRSKWKNTALELYTLEGFGIYGDNWVSRTHMDGFGIPFESKQIASIGDIQPPWSRVLFTGEADEVNEMLVYIKKAYPQYVAVRSCPWFVEVMAQSAGKDKSMLRAAEMLGIDRAHIYAAGDNLNDRAMLDAAALAFVPCNAAREAVEAADVFTPDNDHNVIANALKWLERRYGE